MTFFKAFSPTF